MAVRPKVPLGPSRTGGTPLYSRDGFLGEESMRNVKRLCAVVSLLVAACGASLTGCGGDDTSSPFASNGGSGGAAGGDASKAGSSGAGGSRAGSAGTAGNSGAGGTAGNRDAASDAVDTDVAEVSTEAAPDISVGD